ncbi:MAG: VCBS repeat-containing protein [Flavobacteriaceae bacterium]|nr:VCBS repeat-containing protein [Flavobacteriaceae bacterium]
MIKKITFTVAIFFMAQTVLAQLNYVDNSSALNNPTLYSGVAICIADMNNDGLDDMVRLNDAENLEIEIQETNGTFTRINIGDVDSVWGMTIADVDENGYNDILVGGYYNDLKLVLANSDGTDYTIITLGGPSIFLQNANFADINNDGDIDLFACHDEGLSSPYEGDGAGHLTYNSDLIEAVSTVPSDNSGNYGSIWTDYDSDGDLDLYISKCRLGVTDPNDGRRRNLLFQNDGNNNFTDVAEDAGLLPFAQSWSANFEDIDNDGDFDAVVINHDMTSMIYVNNGDGTFTDITASTGIESELLDIVKGIQVMMEDFDNDGFMDIFITSRDDLHKIFLNNGDLTFTDATTALPASTTRIQSGALGDLNNDGFIDILAAHAYGYNNPYEERPDQMFINEGNSNNWSRILLVGVESNINATGAKVELWGAWGMQIREVRAGESYGTQNSLVNHFGIGSETEIDKVVIHWPSGLTEEYLDINSNENITYVEGDGQLGVSESNSANFSVYPNPADNELIVRYNSDQQFENLTIYDVNGRTILEKSDFGLQHTTLNVSALKTGIYFISIDNQSMKFIKK